MRLSLASVFISVYFFANIILGIYYGIYGSLGGDFKNEIINDYNVYVAAYIGEIISMVIFLLILRVIYIYVTVKNVIVTSNRVLSIFVFFIQTSFLLYSYYTGVGQLSDDFYNITVDNPLKYIFTFFNADYLFLAYFCISRRLSKANIALYLLSNLYRGWFAGALVNIVFISAAKILKTQGVKFKYIIMGGIMFMILAPAIYYIKYVTRGAENTEITAVSSYYSNEMYNEIINAAFSRFQHISETYSIIDNINIIRNGMEQKRFVPFFFENPAKKQLVYIFGYNDDLTITQFAAENILHKIPGNIHVGILTWLLVDPFLSIAYVFFLIFSFITLVFLLKKLTPENVWPYCVWVTLLLAMHGWFTSYFMFIWSLFVIYIMKNMALSIYSRGGACVSINSICGK
ncbi:TPA: oligosaccharide repeat unit polymerase [Escherichia coli]|nr:oligosaccharide repeat unit polymerase [Escherichia coli]